MRRIIPSIVVSFLAGVAAVAAVAAGPARAEGAARYRPGPVGTRPVAPASLEGALAFPRASRLAPSSVAPCAPVAALDPCDPRCDPRRGPLEVRDMYVLAQPRLTLPAVGPDTLGCGRSSFRAQFHWSNSFGWRQDVTGEDPGVRWYLVDGETRTVDATFLHGVAADVDLGVRLPVHGRGAGELDDVIDAFHGLVPGLFKGNKREDFENDKFRVHGLLEDDTPFSQDADKGLGLGNVEGLVRWRCLDGGRDGLSLALVGRATAPTGTAPFDTEGVEAGLQLVAAQRIATHWDLYGGVGETWYETPTFRGIRYAAWRTTVFGAVEWRFCSRGSLLFQLDYAGPLAADVANFAPDVFYTHVGVKWDLAPGTRLELGFTENLVDQQTTADVGLWVGVEHTW